MAKVRRFKYKPVKISHDAIRDELMAMGYDKDDLSFVFCEAINDGGDFNEHDVEQADADIKEAKRRIHQTQEDAQFEAYLSAIS